MEDNPVIKTMRCYPSLLAQSSKSNIAAVDTTNLLEKVNAFVKETGGYFSLTITPTSIEVSYTHANGICSKMGDNLASASDMVADIATRAQEMFKLLLAQEKENHLEAGGMVN